MVKNLPASAGDTELIPGLGRFPGGGNGNPLHYSCLENPMNRRAWQAIYSPLGHKESNTTEQLKKNNTMENSIKDSQKFKNRTKALENSVFISISKKANVKECSNCCTTALINMLAR